MRTARCELLNACASLPLQVVIATADRSAQRQCDAAACDVESSHSEELPLSLSSWIVILEGSC